MNNEPRAMSSESSRRGYKKTRSSGRYKTLGLPGHGDKRIVAKKPRGINPRTRGAK